MRKNVKQTWGDEQTWKDEIILTTIVHFSVTHFLPIASTPYSAAKTKMAPLPMKVDNSLHKRNGGIPPLKKDCVNKHTNKKQTSKM